MTLWQRLNPFNYLFGRIFLWFWLAMALIVISAVWLSIQLSDGYEVSSLTPAERNRVEQTAARLVMAAERRNETNLSILLTRAGHRNKLALMLIEADSKDFVYGVPRGLRPGKAPFLKFLDQPFPLKIESRTGVFSGPVDVTLNERQFKLFVGRTHPPGLFRQIQRLHPGVLPTTVLTVSMLLCGLLAWSIIKPIRQLQRAAVQLSQGDLTARVTAAGRRQDEIGQLATEFNRMSEQIEKLVGGQKRLLADISHELRSPLARLQLAIGIAQQNGDANQTIDRVEKEAHQIEEMLEQVLRLSRLESIGRLQDPQPIDCVALISALVNDAEFEAREQGKEVEFIADQNIWTLGEPMLLSSAAENVIRNAVKYAATKVQVWLSVSQRNISLRIKDDGKGVPADELANLFTPFYRLSASRNRQSGGVGLGLAIAQQAILAHSGEISASNDPAGGLLVTITLPEFRFTDEDDLSGTRNLNDNLRDTVSHARAGDQR